MGDVERVLLDALGVGGETPGVGGERLGGLGRERPGDRRGTLSLLLRSRQRRLLEDQVGVGAAHAKGGDAGAARALAPLPGPRLAQQLDLPRLPVDVGGRLRGVERSWQLFFAQRHRHLDHAADSRCCLGMADVGLERAERERAALAALAAVGGEQGTGLDRVAQRRAGAVRLDRVDVAGLQARVRQCLPDHPLLRRPVRRRQPIRGAVLVGRRALDHGEDAAAVALRVGEALEQEQARALGEAGPVGIGAEGLAAAVRREHLLA